MGIAPTGQSRRSLPRTPRTVARVVPIPTGPPGCGHGRVDDALLEPGVEQNGQRIASFDGDFDPDEPEIHLDRDLFKRRRIDHGDLHARGCVLP